MSLQATGTRLRPHPITTVLHAGARLLPTPIQRLGLEAVLNHILRSHIDAGNLEFLDGRVLCVAITDLGWRWPMTVVNGSLVCLPAACDADVSIQGNARAFMTLALRRIDPDTAFFQRLLVIEGDTELGLAAKNLLDSVEWEQWSILRRLPRWEDMKRRLQP